MTYRIHLQIDSQRKQKSTVKPLVDRQEKATVKKPDHLPDIENMHIYDEKGKHLGFH